MPQAHGRVGVQRRPLSPRAAAYKARRRVERRNRTKADQPSPFLRARSQSRIQQETHRFERFVKSVLSRRRKPGQTWQSAFEEYQDSLRLEMEQAQAEAEANVISVEEDEEGNLVPSSPWPRVEDPDVAHLPEVMTVAETASELSISVEEVMDLFEDIGGFWEYVEPDATAKRKSAVVDQRPMFRSADVLAWERDQS